MVLRPILSGISRGAASRGGYCCVVEGDRSVPAYDSACSLHSCQPNPCIAQITNLSDSFLPDVFLRLGVGILHSIWKATQFVHGTPRLAASHRTWCCQSDRQSEAWSRAYLAGMACLRVWSAIIAKHEIGRLTSQALEARCLARIQRQCHVLVSACIVHTF